MIFVRRKKHHKTTSAAEDEESARRLQAEQLAYDQKCAQMNTGIVLLPRPLLRIPRTFPDQELGYRERYAGDTSVLDDAA